jgi:putative endonuclease
VKRTLGHFGEAWAAGYLVRLGFKVLERNVRYRQGEIDLIARDGDELVFVEVKCRRSNAFGAPQESVTPRRFAHLAMAIERFIADRGLHPASYRIDVIALEVDGLGRVAHHEHIRGVEPPR